LGGQLITFTLVVRAKKEGYWGSAPFSWWVFWALLPDRTAGRPWDYFSRGKSQNGSLQSDQLGLPVYC
jgi:hypothetical protein